jgi:hypothetical protein
MYILYTVIAIVVLKYAYEFFVTLYHSRQEITEFKNSLEGLVETSTDFDLENVFEFFELFHQKYNFFTLEVVDEISKLSHRLQHDEEDITELTVKFKNIESPFVIVFFKCDLEAVRIYIQSHPIIIEIVENEMEAFFELKGM